MSQHTEFRGRGRNHWFATDEDGYMTQEQRFKFVKGTTLPEGEGVPCGEGTYFPFKMTLDQIMEVYYRVRDSKFTQGSDAYHLQGTQPTRQVNFTYSNFVANTRGLYINYPEYEPQMPADYDYLFGEPYGPSGLDQSYRDAIHPHAMWPVWPDVKLEELQDGQYNQYAQGDGKGTTRCGFSTMAGAGIYDDPDDTLYGLRLWRPRLTPPYGYQKFQTFSFFAVGGEVAWVGADSPEDPSAEFYLGCYFHCEIPTAAVVLKSGQEGFPSEGTTFETKFTLRLRAGDENTDPVEFTTGLFDEEGEDNRGGTIVLAATKWWPYAAKDGVTPIWDEDTGLQLNPATL